MTKAQGWRREPARHALAAKGIETGRTKNQIQERHPQKDMLPPAAKRVAVNGVPEQVKDNSVDRILEQALEEGGSKPEAILLLENDQWLESKATAISKEKASGDVIEQSKLKAEIIESIRRDNREPTEE